MRSQWSNDWWWLLTQNHWSPEKPPICWLMDEEHCWLCRFQSGVLDSLGKQIYLMGNDISTHCSACPSRKASEQSISLHTLFTVMHSEKYVWHCGQFMYPLAPTHRLIDTYNGNKSFRRNTLYKQYTKMFSLLLSSIALKVNSICSTLNCSTNKS